MQFEDRMAEIKKTIVSELSKTYSPDSICVYHLAFDRLTLDNWRAEVEAYIDVEDGPYFIIFECKNNRVYSYFNEAKKRNNE
jgi:hypothetical protein